MPLKSLLQDLIDRTRNMNFKSSRLISLCRLYCRLIYHNAFYLFVAMPVQRLVSVSQHHHFRAIGKTKIIGDDAFVGYCEEFSLRLQKEDPSMYDNLFIKNKFIFTQYSDCPFKNIMFGEYAVPAHYQKLKAYGVGALMVYGFYLTELFGRTLRSHAKRMRQTGISNIPNEKTYLWLTQHQFPEEIVRWYSKYVDAAKDEPQRRQDGNVPVKQI